MAAFESGSADFVQAFGRVSAGVAGRAGGAIDGGGGIGYSISRPVTVAIMG